MWHYLFVLFLLLFCLLLCFGWLLELTKGDTANPSSDKPHN